MLCWWCCHSIEGQELHVPYKYNGKEFFTFGHFCSWSCMKSYTIQSTHPNKSEMCSLVALMKKKATGTIEPIVPAPNRFTLKAFGGSLSIEEFRGSKTSVHVMMPYEKFIPCTIRNEASEPQVQGNYENTQKLKAIQESSGASDTLKLKRSKPLKSQTSSIEKTLGIKRRNDHT